MKQMILLFSHQLTGEQKKDAQKDYQIEHFLYLPENLRKIWGNIPSDSKDIVHYLQDIKAFVKESAKEGDVILIQGDFGATYIMVNYVKSLGLRAVYATTQREVMEKREGDSIVKQSIFRHILFREY